VNRRWDFADGVQGVQERAAQGEFLEDVKDPNDNADPAEDAFEPVGDKGTVTAEQGESRQRGEG
jgi:hypothetical protein